MYRAEPFIVILVAVGVIAALVYLTAVLGDVMCSNSWGTSFKPRFSLGTGCLIVVDDVRIPARNYRVM